MLQGVPLKVAMLLFVNFFVSVLCLSIVPMISTWYEIVKVVTVNYNKIKWRPSFNFVITYSGFNIKKRNLK